jgi:uncharacterized membrane protein YfcA
MSGFALRNHAQNGLLKTKGVAWVIFPALLLGAAGAFSAAYLQAVTLKKLFGAFLIGLSLHGVKTAIQSEEKA